MARPGSSRSLELPTSRSRASRAQATRTYGWTMSDIHFPSAWPPPKPRRAITRTTRWPSRTPAATDISRRSSGPTDEPVDTPIQTDTLSASSPHASVTVPALPIGERILLWGSLATLTVLAWLYLIRMPMTPQDLGGLGARMLSALPSRWADWPLTFLMWAVMMVAMMVPSASPMVMAYARVASARDAHPAWRVWSFVAGYI